MKERTYNISTAHLLTAPEAAEFLRVSLRKLQNDVKCRRIPVIKYGRRTLFRRESLEAAIKKMEINTIG
jgi:excisionase family DNA binding protein